METSPTTEAPPSEPRPIPLTALGWLLIVGGVVLLPITVISILMLMAGSPGTSTVEPSGFFLVVIAPPLTALAGIGLLRRWRWAWFYVALGLVTVLVWNFREMAKPPAGPPTVRIGPEGLQTTTYTLGPRHSYPLMVFAAGLLVLVLTPGIRREFGLVRGIPGSDRIPASSTEIPPLP